MGLKTKNPKDRPKSLLLFDPASTSGISGTERKVAIPVEEYPTHLWLLGFDTPCWLKPMSGPMRQVVWINFFDYPNWNLLKQKYGLSAFSAPSFDNYALCRMLAKIAHAYTVAMLGVNGFFPILPNFILGDFDLARYFYVGGIIPENFDGLSEKTAELHQIWIEQMAETWPYVVVRIRLFSQLGAPEYRVMSGRQGRPGAKPEAHLLTPTMIALKNPPTSHYTARSPIPEGLFDHGRQHPKLPVVPDATGDYRWVKVVISPSGLEMPNVALEHKKTEI